MRLVVATCQFPTTADVRRNAREILSLVRRSARRGAHLAQFPECSLSGYAGADVQDHGSTDWEAVSEGLARISAEARRTGTWVVVGSAHRLSRPHKPHNSLYVFDPRGRLVDRYDKCFCAGDRRGTSGDLAHYTPGRRLVTFEVRGVTCGLLICHDYRYPEIYRAYERRGVHLLLHSFHAGGLSRARFDAMRSAVGTSNARRSGGSTIPEITMHACSIAAASSNHVWITCANSSASRSCWGCFAVRPDGVVSGRVPVSVRRGMLLTTVDPAENYYDSSVAWRRRAVRGVLHSGRLVSDPRSLPRTAP